MSKDEMELIEIIRSSKDPEAIFLFALELITDYLRMPEPSEGPAGAWLPAESGTG
jgi:hypothetical protein